MKTNKLDCTESVKIRMQVEYEDSFNNTCKYSLFTTISDLSSDFISYYRESEQKNKEAATRLLNRGWRIKRMFLATIAKRMHICYSQELFRDFELEFFRDGGIFDVAFAKPTIEEGMVSAHNQATALLDTIPDISNKGWDTEPPSHYYNPAR